MSSWGADTAPGDAQPNRDDISRTISDPPTTARGIRIECGISPDAPRRGRHRQPHRAVDADPRLTTKAPGKDAASGSAPE
jgi:hypothetical protein